MTPPEVPNRCGRNASECLGHVQSGDVSWGVVPGFQESLEINLHRPPSLFHSRHAPAQCSLHISY